MFGRPIPWRRWVAAAAVVASGAFGAFAEAPSAERWSADPEEQFLLDVNIRQLRLGDGVRAYNTPTGTCVLFGDFLTVLDLPIKVDLAAKTASGWAFRESHRVEVDLGSRKVSYGTSSETVAAHHLRETPEGWCVDTDALTRWFAIGVKPMTSAAALLLESEAKLPVEMALEREKRAASLSKQVKFDISTIPKVRLPYRMWRVPALDFVVSAGLTYRASDGTRIDRRSAVYAAGEIAALSYDAQIATNSKGRPNMLRLRGYRSDPDGGLLGPLKATHFGFGDVDGFDSRLSANARSGRGAVITNRPLFRPTAFGKTRFEGDLPAGWEAELYRNDELVAFTRPTPDQRYVFDDVELNYGDNQVRVVLYGPQGQVRTREEAINVGQENVPAGKTWYWAGVSQPGRDVVELIERDEDRLQPQAQATVAVEHGVDERMSVGALARTLLVDDERLTFVEGTIRRSIGKAAAEVSLARDSKGGNALGAALIGKVGAVHVRGEALATDDFHLRGNRAESLRDFRLSADSPVRIGRAVIPSRATVRYTDFGNGASQLEASGRISTTIERFNLATDLRLRKQMVRQGQAPPNELEWSLIGSGRVGPVRVRGSSTFRVAPERTLGNVELSGYWSASEAADWEGGVMFDARQKRGNARISHIRRLSSMALAVTGEAASDGSLALGFNLNFSLDPGRMVLSRQPLAGAGVVRARVYRDLNDNGIRDDGEPLEKGALITTGTRSSERKTGADGTVTIGGLPAYQTLAVGIDQTSLADPSLAPRKLLQAVTPRPGVPADVEIGLVGAGAIEGALLKSGELGFEGLDLELVDESGNVVATTMTDFDGFFLFDRVPYGKYRLRISKASVDAARVLQPFNAEIGISGEKSVVRLGALHVDPMPQIASSSP